MMACLHGNMGVPSQPAETMTSFAKSRRHLRDNNKTMSEGRVACLISQLYRF